MRNRGLLQAAKQALASFDRHARLPWGQPGYPTPTPGADLLYEARDYLRAAIEREEAVTVDNYRLSDGLAYHRK